MNMDKIALLINSIALIIFAVRSFILSCKLNKYKSGTDEVKHWIYSIDMDSFNTLHDKNYLAEAKKVLRDM